jgi:hypothetical protein
MEPDFGAEDRAAVLGIVDVYGEMIEANPEAFDPFAQWPRLLA